MNRMMAALTRRDRLVETVLVRFKPCCLRESRRPAIVVVAGFRLETRSAIVVLGNPDDAKRILLVRDLLVLNLQNHLAGHRPS